MLCLGNFRLKLVGLPKNKMLCAEFNHESIKTSLYNLTYIIPIVHLLYATQTLTDLYLACPKHTCLLVVSVPVSLVSLHSVSSTWLLNE